MRQPAAATAPVVTTMIAFYTLSPGGRRDRIGERPQLHDGPVLAAHAVAGKRPTAWKRSAGVSAGEASASGEPALLPLLVATSRALGPPWSRDLLSPQRAHRLPDLSGSREWRAGRRIEAGASDETLLRDSFRTDLAGRRLSRQPRKLIVVQANTCYVRLGPGFPLGDPLRDD